MAKWERIRRRFLIDFLIAWQENEHPVTWIVWHSILELSQMETEELERMYQQRLLWGES